MTRTLETKLEIRSWDEKPYREFADGRKFTRADVVLAGTDELTSGTFDALMYYGSDGTGTYVTLLRLEGAAGSVVLQGRGTYDGTTARVEYEVVAGSGTGDLSGATGTATSVSTHEDYPYMPLTLRLG